MTAPRLRSIGVVLSVGICLLMVLPGATSLFGHRQATPASNLYSRVATASAPGGASAASANATPFNISTGLGNPWGIALDPKDGYLFVSDGGGQDVAVIDGATNSVVSLIKVNSGAVEPSGIIFDPNSNNVYVANFAGGDVTVIGGSNLTVWRHIGIATPPAAAWGAVLDLVTNEMFVTYDGGHPLTAINCSTSQVVGNYTFGPVSSGYYDRGSPFGNVYDSYSRQLFLAGDPVEVVALNAANPWIGTNISVPGSGTGAAYDPNNGVIYNTGNVITEINGTNDTAFATVPAPSDVSSGGEGGTVYDPANNRVYIAVGEELVNFDASTYVFGPNVTLGAGGGFQVIYDPGNKDVYVADGNGDLTVVPTSPEPTLRTATFETTLSPGLSWSVKLHGLYEPSASDSIIFTEKKGTYNYTVLPPKGYSASPAAGQVILGKKNLTVSIGLSATKSYPITFQESGLPSGFRWTVSINGEGTGYGSSKESSTTTVKIDQPNGQWGYSVSGPSGFSAYPTGGTVIVSGKAPAVQLADFAPELNIPVYDGPTGVATSTFSDFTFVSELYSDNVTVINDTLNQVVASVPVGSDPEAIVTEPYNANVYVANSGSNNVTVINGTSLKVITSIGVGSSPYFLHFDPVANEVYVSNTGTTSVSVISVKSNLIVSTITVAGNPEWITEDESTGYLYVDNAESCSSGTCHPVSVISDATNTVVATVSSSSASGTFNFNGGPGIAFDPSNGIVYLLGGYYVYAISTSSYGVVQSMVAGTEGNGGLLYDPATGDMLVSGHNTSVTVIGSSTDSVSKAVKVGSDPGAMTYVPTSGLVYVADVGTDAISVINGSSEVLTGSITVADGPADFSLDLTHSSLYVECIGNTISVVFPPKTFTLTSWPVISEVTTFTTTTTSTITISGSGFGVNPSEASLSDGSIDTIASQTSPSLVISDSGGGTHNWSAGHETSTNLDSIGVYLSSWSSSSIVLRGFGTQLGTTWAIGVNDSLTVVVFGPNGDGTAIYQTRVSSSPTVSELNVSVTTLHAFNIASSGSVTSIAALPAPAARTCVCLNGNLSGFSNLTNLRSGDEFLNITKGSFGGDSAVLVGFTVLSAASVIVIQDGLLYNQTERAYLSTLTLDFHPLAGVDLNLTDSMTLVFRASFNATLGGLAMALDNVAPGYVGSPTASLVSLGADYHQLALDLEALRQILPVSIASLEIWNTVANVMDWQLVVPANDFVDALEGVCELSEVIAIGAEEVVAEAFASGGASVAGVFVLCLSFSYTSVTLYQQYLTRFE
jgi:YVTN family beta-propeller protein